MFQRSSPSSAFISRPVAIEGCVIAGTSGPGRGRLPSDSACRGLRRFVRAGHRRGALDPVPRTRSTTRSGVPGVRQPAPVEREAAAADALGEAHAKALELGDARLDALGPAIRQSCPVRAVGHTTARQLRKLPADLLERQANPLGEDDERHPTDHRPGITAVPGPVPLGMNEVLPLVETQRGSRNATSFRNFPDCQNLSHAISLPHFPLDFKCT